VAARRSRIPPPPARRAVVASARRMRPGSIESTRSQRPWQERCWSFFDELGEIGYAGLFYARILSKIEIYPAVRSADGKSVMRVTTPEVVQVLERIQDATGNRAKLQGRYGVQRFVVGESYLTCSFVDDGYGGVVEEWEMLSGDELRVQPDGTYTRDSGDGAGARMFREPAADSEGQPGEMMVWRLWAPHPKRSGEATAPMRGVIEPCDRLLTLGRAIRARGRSRIAGAGILLFSDNVTSMGEPPAPDAETGDPAGDATEDPMEDPVMREIYLSMTEPIAEEGHASSVVPVMLRVPPDEVQGGIKWFSLAEVQGYPEATQVEQEIKRIALGLDMPPEALLGVSGMNHWSAWFTGEEAYRSHGQSVVEDFCSDVTSAYAGPAFDELGMTQVDVDVSGETQVIDVAPGQIFVWYDDSAVVLNPDRAKDAKDAHDRIVISDVALRDALGFDPNDAPSPEEHQARLDAKRPPQIGAPSGQPAGDQPADVQPGAPEPGAAAARRAAYLAGLVERTIVRAVEQGAARFRTRLQANESQRIAFQHVDNRRLCATAGRDLVRSLCGPSCERMLVGGVADRLLAGRLNGHARELLNEVEAIAADHLYAVDGEPRLTRRAVDLILAEARAEP
jgi:hypothetical protein